MDHYIEAIHFLGTTDNYNMGWCASNKRDEFPQITRWLSRQENVNAFDRDLGSPVTGSGQYGSTCPLLPKTKYSPP